MHFIRILKLQKKYLDSDENWWTVMYTPPSNNYTDIYQTLLHEIEHSLGLYHSNVLEDIIYTYLKENVYELSENYIYRIWSLYGGPPKNISQATTSLVLVNYYYYFD